MLALPVMSSWGLAWQSRRAGGTGRLPNRILGKSQKVGNSMVLGLNQLMRCQEDGDPEVGEIARGEASEVAEA